MSNVQQLYTELLVRDNLTPALFSVNKELTTLTTSLSNVTQALKELTTSSRFASETMQNLNINNVQTENSMTSLLMNSSALISIFAQLGMVKDNLFAIYLGLNNVKMTLYAFTAATKLSSLAWTNKLRVLETTKLMTLSSRLSGVNTMLLMNAKAANASRISWLRMLLVKSASAVLVGTAGAVSLLTAALNSARLASLAFLVPWLPIIAVAGAVIGAGWLLWDLFNNGWDNSVLGGTLTNLKDFLLPGLAAVWTGLTEVVENFISWIQTIPQWINDIWTSIQNHPLWPIFETLFRLTPFGFAMTTTQAVTNLVTGGYDESAVFGKMADVSTQNITVSPVIYSSTEINGTNLSQKEIEEMMERNNAKVQRNLGQELNRGLISYL